MKDALAIIAIACCLWVGLFGVPTIPGIVEPPLIDGGGLSVLVVHETDDDRALPKEQVSVFTSQIVRDFVKHHGGEIRVWDDDIDNQDGEKWRKAMTIERASLPWLIVSGPKGNYSGPLPADVAATVVQIEKCVE